MLDATKHYLKYASLWLTSRGLTSLMMMGAVLMLGADIGLAVLTVLPVSLAVSTYLSNDDTNFRKVKMRNAYRHELAAELGIDPKTVTVEDLDRVAKGAGKFELQGNGVLKDQLDKYYKERNFSILSTALAIGISAVAVMAMSLGSFAAIPEFVSGALGNSPVGSLFVNTDLTALSLTAGGVSFASDLLITQVGKSMMGLNKTTAYEYIQNLKALQRDGYAISPEQVMGVFALHDKGLAGRIEQQFGVPYDELPKQTQSMITIEFGERFHVLELADKINNDRILLNELAYAAEGKQSGVPEQDPSLRKRRSVILDRFLTTEEEKGEELEGPEQHVHIVQGDKAAAPIKTGRRGEDMHAVGPHTQRYLAERVGRKQETPAPKADSQVERLQQQADMESTTPAR